MKTVLQPANPALFDAALVAYNTRLKAALPWLTNSYGKAQRLSIKDEKGRVQRFPGIYSGEGKDYIDLLPAEAHGNFSWWDLGDYKVTQEPGKEIISAPFGLVLWFNAAKVLPVGERRNLESIKSQVLQFFYAARLVGYRLQVEGITEENERIYQGYSITRAAQGETQNQYLMHPFAGLRFNGIIHYEKLC